MKDGFQRICKAVCLLLFLHIFIRPGFFGDSSLELLTFTHSFYLPKRLVPQSHSRQFSYLPLEHCPTILQSIEQHAHPGDGSQSSPKKCNSDWIIEQAAHVYIISDWQVLRKHQLHYNEV